MANSNYFEVLQALQDLPQTGGMPQIGIQQPGIPPPAFDPSSLIPAQAPGQDLGALAPPAAPSAPIDQSILQQYLALAGPAPVAPTPQPVSTLDRIAAALQGVQAGFQGRGGEFAAGLRAERERPQKEFEAKQRDYDQRKLSLGLTGTQAAMSAEEKRQARVTGEADRQFELDVKNRARQMGIEDQTAFAKLQDAMQTERDAKRAAADQSEQQRKFDQQMKVQKAQLRKGFLDQGAGKYADELASYSLGEIDELSPKAEKANLTIQAKINALQRRAAGAGGGARTPKEPNVFVELTNGQVVPYKALKLDAQSGGLAGFAPGADGKPVQISRFINPSAPPPPAAGVAPGTSGAPGAAAAPFNQFEALQQFTSITAASKNAGKDMNTVISEIRSAPKPPNVPDSVWEGLKGRAANEAARLYGQSRAPNAQPPAEPIRPSTFGR